MYVYESKQYKQSIVKVIKSNKLASTSTMLTVEAFDNLGSAIETTRCSPALNTLTVAFSILYYISIELERSRVITFLLLIISKK